LFDELNKVPVVSCIAASPMKAGEDLCGESEDNPAIRGLFLKMPPVSIVKATCFTNATY
jgi:hypothetical protein